MNAVSKWTIALALLSGMVYGQVPSTNDTSTTDGRYNTGMGTGAINPATTGTYNTASGYQALYSNTSGGTNTASGVWALYSNTGGNNNTASGNTAMYDNTTGSNNTALGYEALYSNTTGNVNTALGNLALYLNNGNDNTGVGFQALAGANPPLFGTGSYNTGIGAYALAAYSTGSSNTASGYKALFYNTSGSNNTAAGVNALMGATYPATGTGSNNTAVGANALFSYSTGSNNTASGYQALYETTTGVQNTASGMNALYFTTGSNNIAVGYEAGYSLTTGNNNIDIGNEGAAGESGIIRIGTTHTQTTTYIAGIENSKVIGKEVFVTTTGQLGVKASAERYKIAIEPMDAKTEKLNQLRPVSFHLKSDPQGEVQYGLIAEEVAKVYPELVTWDDKGQIDGVRYDELAPMLLNETQKQQATIAAQNQRIASLEQQLTGIQAALVKLQPKEQLVAQR